jgi:phenylalanyl-tRNA synthetase alpha chain
LANEVREKIAAAIAEKNARLEEEEVKRKLKEQTIDVTLPGSPVKTGARIADDRY